MTGPDTAREVAARLTKAQRDLVIEGGSCVRAYRPAQKLVELGIWSDTDDEYAIWPRWTPLGLEVRALLQDTSHG